MQWRDLRALVVGVGAALWCAACGLSGHGEEGPGEEGPGEDYEGSFICQEKSPAEVMPQGCPSARPSEGTECPRESEGARCPGGLYEVGPHYRQTVMYCEDGEWVDRSQPCSNDCTARGPNAIELPDDCDSRPTVACDGQPLASLVAAAVNQCEVEVSNNRIQVEVIDGCARVVSSNNAVGKCVTDALSSKHWECGDGFVCATAGHILL